MVTSPLPPSPAYKCLPHQVILVLHGIYILTLHLSLSNFTLLVLAPGSSVKNMLNVMFQVTTAFRCVPMETLVSTPPRAYFSKTQSLVTRWHNTTFTDTGQSVLPLFFIIFTPRGRENRSTRNTNMYTSSWKVSWQNSKVMVNM